MLSPSYLNTENNTDEVNTENNENENRLNTNDNIGITQTNFNTQTSQSRRTNKDVKNLSNVILVFINLFIIFRYLPLMN